MPCDVAVLLPCVPVAPPSIENAKQFFEKTAAANNVAAMHNLGTINYQAKNFEKAATWYRRAANQNYSASLLSPAEHYFRGQGVKKDLNRYQALLKQAADNGHAPSMYKLALWLTPRKGEGNDVVTAIELLTSAANSDYAPALHDLAMRMDDGASGAQKNSIAAAYYLFRAIDLGDDVDADYLITNWRLWTPSAQRALKTILTERGLMKGRSTTSFRPKPVVRSGTS